MPRSWRIGHTCGARNNAEPTAPASGDFSKMSKGMPAFCSMIPNVRPARPAPMMRTCGLRPDLSRTVGSGPYISNVILLLLLLCVDVGERVEDVYE